MKKKYLSMGFFSNLLGLETGAVRAGFHNIFSTDIEEDAQKCFPLLSKSKEDSFLLSNIKDLTFDKIKSALHKKYKDIKPGDVDLIVGGPPCFGMTKLSGNRTLFHDYSMLMFDMIRLVNEIQPKVVIMEQVPDVIQPSMEKFFGILRMVLNDSNYNWDVQVLNAANYGCNQSRDRAIFILVRKDLGVPSYPKPKPVDLSKQSAFAVCGTELIMDDSFSGKDKTKVKIRSGKDVLGTMTSGDMKVMIDGQWKVMDIEMRKKFAHMTDVDLSETLCETSYQSMLGSMVLPPFAEALARHVLKQILKM